MPEAVSYARVADDTWTSGTYVTWGTQNRETPLRLVATPQGLPERWEVRCLDGMANTYLALHVIMATGLQGLREEAEMKLKDCQGELVQLSPLSIKLGELVEPSTAEHIADFDVVNPSQISESDRADLGITEKLPVAIGQSLENLEKDASLKEILGAEVVEHYLAMKKAEVEMLGKMSEHESYVWLMERY